MIQPKTRRSKKLKKQKYRVVQKGNKPRAQIRETFKQHPQIAQILEH